MSGRDPLTLDQRISLLRDGAAYARYSARMQRTLARAFPTEAERYTAEALAAEERAMELEIDAARIEDEIDACAD